MRNEIIDLIEEALKSRNEYFMNEQEVQIYLANYLYKTNNFQDVFLEYYIPINEIKPYPWKKNKKIYIDIVVYTFDKYYPIEIKYKTKTQEVPLKLFGSRINLSLGQQGAQNIGCYDFWKDIKRLEILEEKFPEVEKGIMLFITNDETYLLRPRNKTVGYAQFALNEDKTVYSGEKLDWNGSLSISDNRPPIKLKHNYTLKWKDLKLDQHKYLLV